jgi:hypothetical protein
MPRRLIAFLIACVAIVFAFASLAAIRWPSIVMFLSLFFHTDPSPGLDAINWRQLGFAYGAPYFLASLCFYASAACLSRRAKGSVLWYLMGCCAASPSIYMIRFTEGWWVDPNGLQGIWAGGVLMIAMLGYAVLLLRRRPVDQTVPENTRRGGVHLTDEQFAALLEKTTRENPDTGTKPARPQPRRKSPVPAAIARQRAQFAADGRRMLARQNR